MANKACLSADHYIPANLGRPRYARLRCNYSAFANFYVMGDLYEVIELGAGFYDGGTHGSPVDSGIGADLHVILQDNIADLGNLFKASVGLGCKAKAVATDHGAG